MSEFGQEETEQVSVPFYETHDGGEVNEPIEENITISIIEEPESMPEPMPEPIEEPESIPEPIVEPESMPEPIEEVAESIAEVAEPVVEHVLTPEPVAEVIEPESIAEVAEPVIEVIEPEPIVEPESTPEPVIEVIEPVEDPIVEVAEHVLTPEPVTEKKTEVPTLIFIVPYRDRESHYKIFASTMKTALENAPSYKIFYLHQTDSRNFNRGAMKNIGFLAVKQMYPSDYQNITLVFNDVDTMPAKDTVLDYKTTPNVIKHFYGFDYTLGGIVSILASDFERLNGFPNFWAWGFEDNLIQTRAQKCGMVIDRSVFYKIGDPRITQLTDTIIREVNRTEYDRFLQNTTEGIDSIRGLKYEVKEETGVIDVLQFNTTVQENTATRYAYDLRNGPAPFNNHDQKNRRIPRMKMHF